MFCRCALLGRASQGRGRRSSGTGKAASGGPAACTKSHMFRVSRPLFSASVPGRAPQGCGSGSSREAKAASGGLAASSKSYMREFRGRWFLCQEEIRKAAEAEAAEQERRLQVDRQLEFRGRWFLRAALSGRASQGRGRRSSRTGKAASGGPAA